jgi:hypothetical protein
MELLAECRGFDSFGTWGEFGDKVKTNNTITELSNSFLGLAMVVVVVDSLRVRAGASRLKRNFMVINSRST